MVQQIASIDTLNRYFWNKFSFNIRHMRQIDSLRRESSDFLGRHVDPNYDAIGMTNCLAFFDTIASCDVEFDSTQLLIRKVFNRAAQNEFGAGSLSGKLDIAKLDLIWAYQRPKAVLALLLCFSIFLFVGRLACWALSFSEER